MLALLAIHRRQRQGTPDNHPLRIAPYHVRFWGKYLTTSIAVVVQGMLPCHGVSACLHELITVDSLPCGFDDVDCFSVGISGHLPQGNAHTATKLDDQKLNHRVSPGNSDFGYLVNSRTSAELFSNFVVDKR